MKKKKEEDRWIDVHDDEVMRQFGLIRPMLQSPRDESVWTKTPNERRILNTVKHTCKDDMHFRSVPTKRGTVRAKLIVQIKPNKQFYKSTYSFDCLDTEISEIVSRFDNAVVRYAFNGQTLWKRA